ncbi:MAG: patatin-like phospholipase family protein [Candidatus Krumholzibacteriota bacterium]|nr:patatin-like phospholipase family protein [Candidatus Krumholzibacteriota bacterium]
MPDSVLLIDAMGFIFRSYYAHERMIGAQGQPTNASFGYLDFLIRAIAYEKPSHVASVFDFGPTTFRNELYPYYKANRGETPEDLLPQFKQCERLTEALGIRILKRENYEADDVMASMAVRCREVGLPVIVYSLDKDMAQLVDDGLQVYDPPRQRRYTPRTVRKIFGVAPEQIPDYLALTGDSSDNIPGVPGVGKQTAVALIEAFGSIQGIYGSLDETSRIPVRGAHRLPMLLAEHRDDVRLFRRLVTLVKDLDLDAAPEDLRWQGADRSACEALFEELGFLPFLRFVPRWRQDAVPHHRRRGRSNVPRLGLALGAGGARGLAHLGVMAVLEEAGLKPCCVAGTSMGAIVGALYADRRNAGQAAEAVIAYTDDEKFRASWQPFVEEEEPPALRGFFSELRRSLQRRILTFRTFTSPSQQSAETLLAPLRLLFARERIEELDLPFAAVAVDLLDGEPVVFREGPLVEAIYASSAIPGVFPPLAHEGRLLVDGGGPYRVPVDVCRELGADFVLAVDIPSFSPVREEFKTGLDVLMRSDAIARSRLNRMILREADFVVRPEVGAFHWANFAASAEIRASGEAAMRAALPDLDAALARRAGLGERVRRLLGGWLSRSA